MRKLGILVAMVTAIAWIAIINGDESNICTITGSRIELVPEVEVQEVRAVDYLVCGECGCDTCPEYRIVYENRTVYVNRTVYYEYEQCCEGWCGEDCDTPLCEPPCPEGSICTAPNTCTCPEGYEISGTGCEDIDECDTGNDGGCEHDCINTEGSYHCECDEGYTLNEDGRTCDFQCGEPNSKCIGCTRYQIFTSLADTGEIKWLPAKQHCEDLGGVLAMPKTQDIDTQLRQYITSHNLDLEVNKGFWIGLHDQNVEGEYEWMDGTKLSDTGFINWASNNPNDDTGKDINGQDCVQMWGKRSLLWDDDYCEVQSKGHICEYDICS